MQADGIGARRNGAGEVRKTHRGVLGAPKKKRRGFDSPRRLIQAF